MYMMNKIDHIQYKHQMTAGIDRQTHINTLYNSCFLRLLLCIMRFKRSPIKKCFDQNFMNVLHLSFKNVMWQSEQ